MPTLIPRTTLLLALTAILLFVARAQPLPEPVASPWDLTALDPAPKWTMLERPKLDGVKALTFEGLPFRGKPTRVFAWLGLPAVAPDRKSVV